MDANHTDSLVSQILAVRDRKGCWNSLNPDEKGYPQLNHYVPIYEATLWTLILLADIRCDPNLPAVQRPLRVITDHFFDTKNGIYSLGKTHFPIPCLNGNILYLHGYFGFDDSSLDEGALAFFARYQRFDDGDFRTPSSFPYCSNRSCYGKHTCYWGVTKLLKGLSFLPASKRSKNAKELMEKCIEFVLRHKVCFSSHDHSRLLHKSIERLTFPNMIHSDFLEILWLLKREKRKTEDIKEAIKLLKSKMHPDSTWRIERRMNPLATRIRSEVLSAYITHRARDVVEFFDV